MEPWGPGILSEDAQVEGKPREGWGCAVVRWGPPNLGAGCFGCFGSASWATGGEDQQTDGRKTQREGERLYGVYLGEG